MNGNKSLVISVILNVFLTGSLCYLAASRATVPDVVPARHGEKASSSAFEAETSPPGTNSDKISIGPTPAPFDWRAVESEDYRKYIRNLRSIGCPEETIKDIIVADVGKLFEARKSHMKAAHKKFEYWKSGNSFAAIFDEEKMKQRQELSLEKKALLKELLGREVETPPEATRGMNPLETVLDFLSDKKQTQLIDLEEKFGARLAKSLSGVTFDAEDARNMRTVKVEKEAEVAKLLTPQEKLEYDLRMSQTAMVLRSQLGEFQPTEQEFRSMFQLKKAFDDEFGFVGVPAIDRELRQQRHEAGQYLNDQLKTLLGEQRFSDYQREQDLAYKGISKVVDRYGLPKETAIKAYEIKKTAEEQSSRLRLDASLSNDQRQQALGKINTETEQAIISTMGKEAFKSYQDQPGAFWLRSMNSERGRFNN